MFLIEASNTAICNNHGKIIESSNEAKCFCDTGYSGEFCETSLFSYYFVVGLKTILIILTEK